MPGPEFSAKDISEACGGRVLHGALNAVAFGVSTDTRTIEEGQAFFALVGANHDGHDHIYEAVAGGATIIAGHKEPDRSSLPADCVFILVNDTTDALMRLAAWHRRRLLGKVIAVSRELREIDRKGNDRNNPVGKRQVYSCPQKLQ